MAGLHRVCHLPVIGEQPDYSGFMRKEFSRELTPQAQSREMSREFEGAVGGEGKTRTSINLPVNLQDAIIMLVQKEITVACDPIAHKLSMLQNEVDYMAQNIKQIQDVLPSGPMIAGIPDAVSDMDKRTTETTNAVAMHSCRIQEAEHHIQEMAALQRELAATLSSKAEPVAVNRKHDLYEVRIAKIESAITELQGSKLSAPSALSPPRSEEVRSPIPCAPSAPSSPRSKEARSPIPNESYHEAGIDKPSAQEFHRLQEVKPPEANMKSLQGDQETEMDLDTWQTPQRSPIQSSQPAPVQHEDWFAQLVSDVGKSPDDHHGTIGTVDASQIQLEEGSSPKLEAPKNSLETLNSTGDFAPHAIDNDETHKTVSTKDTSTRKFGFPRWLGFRRGSKS